MKTKFFISIITTCALIFSWQHYRFFTSQYLKNDTTVAQQSYQDIEIYEPIIVKYDQREHKLDRWVTFEDGSNRAITIAPDYGFIFSESDFIDFIDYSID